MMGWSGISLERDHWCMPVCMLGAGGRRKHYPAAQGVRQGEVRTRKRVGRRLGLRLKRAISGDRD